MRLRIRPLLDNGRARCSMGYREQCPHEGRWLAGGHFVMCDEDARLSLRPRRLTEREARDKATAMDESKRRQKGVDLG